MRFALPLVLLALVASLLGGCGGSADGITSSDEVTFSGPVPIRAQWEHTPDCARPPGASR